ncbi:MAG TPA: chemotaxis protein CheB [Waterburya sp.]
MTRLVKALPSDLLATLFVRVHSPAYGFSVLPSILTRDGSLPAKPPQDGEAIERGRIYLAPPDYHLLIQQDYIY